MCVCHPPPRERKRECMHGREHVCVSVCVHTQVCVVKVTKIYPRTLFPYFIQKVFVLFLLFSGMRHWQVEVCLFIVCLFVW